MSLFMFSKIKLVILSKKRILPISTNQEKNMKCTVAELKKKVKALVAYERHAPLSKQNPYWLNSDYIKAVESQIDYVQAIGNDAPDRRFTVTTKQRVSLDNWVRDLKDTYLS